MKTDQPADVTVIVPYYNSRKTIDRAIHSILNQTVQVKEIIVIDDGSEENQIITKDDFYIGGAPLFPTLTIGDILNILPERIHKNYYLEIGKCYVGYCCEDHISLNGEVGEKLIDSLFEMLKWCIKENYIVL